MGRDGRAHGRRRPVVSVAVAVVCAAGVVHCWRVGKGSKTAHDLGVSVGGVLVGLDLFAVDKVSKGDKAEASDIRRVEAAVSRGSFRVAGTLWVGMFMEGGGDRAFAVRGCRWVSGRRSRHGKGGWLVQRMGYDLHRVRVEALVGQGRRGGLEDGRDVVLGDDVGGDRGRGLHGEVLLDVSLEDLGGGGRVHLGVRTELSAGRGGRHVGRMPCAMGGD